MQKNWVEEQPQVTPLRRIWRWIAFFQYTGGSLYKIKEDIDGNICLTVVKAFSAICIAATMLCMTFQYVTPQVLQKVGYSSDKLIEIGKQDGMQKTDFYSIYLTSAMDLVSMLTLPLIDYKMKETFPKFVNKLTALELTLSVPSKHLNLHKYT